jgi:hypothetical protein
MARGFKVRKLRHRGPQVRSGLREDSLFVMPSGISVLSSPGPGSLWASPPPPLTMRATRCGAGKSLLRDACYVSPYPRRKYDFRSFPRRRRSTTPIQILSVRILVVQISQEKKLVNATAHSTPSRRSAVADDFLEQN